MMKRKLINLFDIQKLANKPSGLSDNIVKFAIRHSYITGEFHAGVLEVINKEPLISLILNSVYFGELSLIRDKTEKKFDEIENFLIVPLKKTFLGSANTKKTIKYVRDLTESQKTVYDEIKSQQPGEFFEISLNDAEEKFKGVIIV
jgi:hypothetical protein